MHTNNTSTVCVSLVLGSRRPHIRTPTAIKTIVLSMRSLQVRSAAISSPLPQCIFSFHGSRSAEHQSRSPFSVPSFHTLSSSFSSRSSRARIQRLSRLRSFAVEQQFVVERSAIATFDERASFAF